MRIVKKQIKNYKSKSGKEVNVFKIISEDNDKQTDPKKEKFDLHYKEVRKIYDKLKSQGKKFIIQGLNPKQMCAISDINQNFIYKDSMEYLDGNDGDVEAYSKFSQVIITIF